MSAGKATIIGAIIGAVGAIIASIIIVAQHSGEQSNASGAQSSGTRSSLPASSSPGTQPTIPSPTSRLYSAAQYLSDLTAVASSGAFDTGSAEVNGSNYSNSVIFYLNPGPVSVEYNLGRQWRNLDATVGLRDDSSAGQKFEFQVFADGHSIYDHVFGLGQSSHISVNVTGVLRLKLAATLLSDYVGEAYGVWGKANLTS